MNLQILPIQTIFSLLLIWPISRLVLRYKEGSVALGAFLFWVLIWLSAIVVIFLPNISTSIANYVGIGRGSDLISYGAIGVLFYLVFRMNVMLEDVRNEISRVVREIAIREHPVKKSIKKKQTKA